MSLLRGFIFFFLLRPNKDYRPKYTNLPTSQCRQPATQRAHSLQSFLPALYLLRWQSSNRNLSTQTSEELIESSCKLSCECMCDWGEHTETACDLWENTMGAPCYVGSVKATQGVPPLGGRTNESGPCRFLMNQVLQIFCFKNTAHFRFQVLLDLSLVLTLYILWVQLFKLCCTHTKGVLNLK